MICRSSGASSYSGAESPGTEEDREVGAIDEVVAGQVLHDITLAPEAQHGGEVRPVDDPVAVDVAGAGGCLVADQDLDPKSVDCSLDDGAISGILRGVTNPNLIGGRHVVGNAEADEVPAATRSRIGRADGLERGPAGTTIIGDLHEEDIRTRRCSTPAPVLSYQQW